MKTLNTSSPLLRVVGTAACLLFFPIVLACGASGFDTGGGGGAAGDWAYEDTSSWKPGAEADAGGGWDVPEPEEELDFTGQAPAASENYVYIPAEARDSVIRVDAESLEIRMIPVGGLPNRVAALPADDVAVVINSGTGDLSVIRSTPEDDDVEFLPTLPAVNALAVSPTGNAVVVY